MEREVGKTSVMEATSTYLWTAGLTPAGSRPKPRLHLRVPLQLPSISRCSCMPLAEVSIATFPRQAAGWMKQQHCRSPTRQPCWSLATVLKPDVARIFCVGVREGEGGQQGRPSGWKQGHGCNCQCNSVILNDHACHTPVWGGHTGHSSSRTVDLAQ